jgi:prolycopene isomerase
MPVKTSAKPSVANPNFPASTAGVVADRLPEEYPREFDAIVIGSGMGGLVTATQLAAKGAKVLVLERT